VVPHLFLRRQREEALAALERPGDELVGDAVVLEDDEAVLLVRRAEGLRIACEDEGTGVSERIWALPGDEERRNKMRRRRARRVP
jgi:ADP-ribose pyrophosphatase YjhB (NUDIX family)